MYTLNRCVICGEEFHVVCCGLSFCVECWSDHDIEKHDYPEVPDED